MTDTLRRVPRLALGAGALVFALGLWGAMRGLPEWRGPAPARPSDAPERLRRDFAAQGAKLTVPSRLALLARDDDGGLFAQAYRLLGRGAAEYLASTGGAVEWAVRGDLEFPGVASGPVTVRFDPAGAVRSISWLPGGTLFQLTLPDERVKNARAAAFARLQPIVLRGAPKEGEPTTRTRGNQNVVVQLLATPPGSPGEALVTQGPFQLVVSRELPPDAEALREPQFGHLALHIVPALLVAVTALVLFVVLLVRRRLSPRIALVLGGLPLSG